jgi:hypothetical protein
VGRFAHYRADWLRRARERGPASIARAIRLTAAAVASYAIALTLVSDKRPVTAALTALLIVQVTLFGTVADTIRRILSVLLGVAVAITVSEFAGFTWWSLAALVLTSILLGQALRLGAHLLEVPISAMLILAAGGAGAAASDRVAETLIGAAVGLLLNVMIPPSTRARTAGEAVENYARTMAELLDRIAGALRDASVSRETAYAWLREQRAITHDIAHVDRVLAETQESRRLNPRAAGSWNPVPDLRSGLDALEHSAVALRLVLRSIADGAAAAIRPSGGGEPADRADDAAAAADADADAERRRATAAVLGDLARCLARYGTVVRAGAQSDATPAELNEALDALRDALRAVRRSRARLTERLQVDPRVENAMWPLHGSLLAGLDRVIEELDLDVFARGRDRRRREAAERTRPATQAAKRLRSSARRVATEYPVVRRRQHPR